MDDLKKILLSSSVENKQVKRVSYSKETLLILSKNSPCQNQPDCLHDSFFNDDGYWDPELWHQSFPASKDNNEDLQKPLSSSFSGSELVLGPQRRSFQGGCHVSVKPAAADSKLGPSKLPLKLTKSQDVTPNQKPRLRSFQSENYGWSRDKVSDKRDHGFQRSRKPDYKKQQSFGGRSFEHRGHAFEEHEPEWFSCGPESKFDTIELQGFEDGGDFGWMGKEIPMDDVPTRKKKPGSEERTKPSKKTAGYDDALEDTNKEVPVVESSKNVKTTTNVEDASNNGLPETKEALSSLKESNQELGVNDASNDVCNQVSRSRFSRWFKSEQINLTDEGGSKRTEDPAENIGDSNSLKSSKQESADVIPAATNVPQSVPQSIPLSVSSLGPQPSSILHSIVPQTSVPQSSSSASDPHQADAFNRLIASIRATDKVKEQMQQRNQQIQALQSIMSSTSNAKNDSSCVTVSSLEGLTLDKHSGQQINLKQQFERQKDAYHQKIRQIEQQKSASPTFYGNSESYNPMSRDGRNTNASTNSDGFHNSQQSDIAEESALATASLAAKLSGKLKKNLQMSNSKPASAMDEMRRDTSGRPSPSFDPKQHAATSSQQQQDNALLIAQMLAKAGVTEDQLKQLTLKQQELIISMVQNQFSHKDIVKIMGASPAAQPPAKSAGDNLADLRNPLKKPLLAQNPPESAPEAPNFMGRFSHVPPQQQQVNIIHPAMISPMVPHIVRQGIPPHMLAPTVNPHMPQLLHQTQTNPAVLLQLQHQQQQQQMYASQVAQQQALIAAALQNQQHPAHNATAQQQIQHKLRMGSRESADDHFKNPLSQWFSREVLRQSQFHNSQQFLQQQAYYSPNPDARPDAKH